MKVYPWTAFNLDFIGIPKLVMVLSCANICPNRNATYVAFVILPERLKNKIRNIVSRHFQKSQSAASDLDDSSQLEFFHV